MHSTPKKGRTDVTPDSLASNKLKREWLRDKDQCKAEFSRILHETGLIRFMITKTGKGGLAPYFVKLDLLPSYPKEFQRALDIMLKTIKFEVGLRKFSRIAATTTHVLPYAAIMTYSLDLPMLFIEVGKTEGRKRRIDGILNPSEKVLIIDDVISTGKTATLAAYRLRSEGGLVQDFVALLDNEKGGKERLRGQDVNVHTFITISEVADYLEKMSLITSDERKLIHEWVKRSHSS